MHKISSESRKGKVKRPHTDRAGTVPVAGTNSDEQPPVEHQKNIHFEGDDKWLRNKKRAGA